MGKDEKMNDELVKINDRKDLVEDDGELLSDDDLGKVSGGEDSSFMSFDPYSNG